VKRTKLERHLRSLGCVFVTHGANHDRWMNTVTLSQTTIPRHTEIKKGMVIGICRALDVPRPSER
jgi:mRNA interferase HicA